MSQNADGERYGLPARMMHWLVALAIPIQFGLGWASELSASRGDSARLISLHYQAGMVIGLLMVLRLTWRLMRGAPSPPLTGNRWRTRIAVIVHWMMYGLLFLLPISGYIIWVWMDASMDIFGVLNVPRVFTPPVDDETGRALAWYVHYWAGWLLLALIALHASAAVWHQWIRRDGLISKRMT